MIAPYKRTLAGVLVALASSALHPVTAQEDDDSALPVYRVELIVFEYLSSLGSEEDWSADPRRTLTTTPGDAVSGETDDIPTAVDEAASTAMPALRFRLVDADGEALTDAFGHMRASRDYRPLLHTAWEQPGYARDGAPGLDLARVDSLPARLRGTVTLSLARYLHLDLALDLDPASVIPTESRRGFGAAVPVYRLRESRRMRSRELHFFDHPKFGVLVRIDPVETRPSGAAAGE